MRDLRKKQGIGTERQIELKELLETCDLVKFAKFRPTAQDGGEDLTKAINFVESTRTHLSPPSP
jgi:hypothetical protein